jgi:hypothetical protein
MLKNRNLFGFLKIRLPSWRIFVPRERHIFLFSKITIPANLVEEYVKLLKWRVTKVRIIQIP